MAGHIRPGTLRRAGGSISSSSVDVASSSAISSPATDVPAGGKKLVAPNKKQHELDLKEFSDKIASKEHDIVTKKQQFVADAAANASRRAALPAEIREADDKLKKALEDLKTRNDEIDKKDDEVNKLRPKMTYRSESQIDAAINTLEYQRSHRNYSMREEEKIIREIDKLRRSKNELRVYNKLDAEIKMMRNSRDELRKHRQTCYIGLQRLNSEDKSLRDLDQRHKMEIDTIGRDIQDLRYKLYLANKEFDIRMVEWETHLAANRRWRHLVEQQKNSARATENVPVEPVVRDPFAWIKQVIGSLLTYLQPFVKAEDGIASSLPSTSQDSSAQPPPRASTPPPPPEQDTPGYFLPKKHSDMPTTPTRAGGLAKGKKDKRKTKPIAHSAAVVAQFTSLDLLPPANTSEIPAIIEALKAKKLDLDKQTLAKFASMTPKNSPTEEELPPLPGTSSKDVTTTSQTESSSVPSITVSGAVDEPDYVPAIAIPDSSSEPSTSISEIGSISTSEEDQTELLNLVISENDKPFLLRHSFTVESISETEEDLSLTSLSEGTAENSADDEEDHIHLTHQVEVSCHPTKHSQNSLSVQLSSGGGDGHQDFHKDYRIDPKEFPETPPIDEAFTKPLFPSVMLKENTE